MQQLENNAFFWQKLDTLLLSSSCTIDRPKGSAHYKFTNLIYPVDYGFLSDTFGSDQKPIDVFKGSIATNNAAISSNPSSRASLAIVAYISVHS